MGALEDFAILVRDMRDKQRTYFRDRTPAALDAAKKAEHKVDCYVKDVLEPSPPNLFDR